MRLRSRTLRPLRARGRGLTAGELHSALLHLHCAIAASASRVQPPPQPMDWEPAPDTSRPLNAQSIAGPGLISPPGRSDLELAVWTVGAIKIVATALWELLILNMHYSNGGGNNQAGV